MAETEISDDLAHAAADFACAALPRALLGRERAIRAARNAIAGGEFNTLFREYVRAFVAAAQWIEAQKVVVTDEP